MDDLISRQAAIDALRTCYDTETITMDNGDEYINYGDAVGEIEQLPSAQPEIVRCKDCGHYRHGLCMKASMCVNKSENGFCDWAEKREVTT